MSEPVRTNPPCRCCQGTGKVVVKAASVTPGSGVSSVNREHLCPACKGGGIKGLTTK